MVLLTWPKASISPHATGISTVTIARILASCRWPRLGFISVREMLRKSLTIAGTFRASALVREPRRRVLQPPVSGLPELDEVLPLGGLVAGSLVDLHADDGAGAFVLALRVAAQQLRASAGSSRSVVVIDSTEGSMGGAMDGSS